MTTQSEVVIIENEHAVVWGFLAGVDGRPKSSNPFTGLLYTGGYNWNSWNYGYDCFEKREMPLEVIKRVGAKVTQERVRLNFCKTGTLADKIRNRVDFF